MRLGIVLAVLIVLFAVVTARGEQKVIDHDFIGADRCGACHKEELAAWQKSPHARAFEVLSEKDRRDPRCLSCHTLVPDDVSVGLTGIQCESCHGPGRHYAIDYVMRDAELSRLLSLTAVEDKTCLRCHTDSSPSLTPFVVKDKLPLIKHWKDKPASAK
jgi:hypothetical protein